MKNSIKHIINSYSGKSFSKRTVTLFGRWLIASDNLEKKEKTLIQLWDDTASEVTNRTWEDLDQIKQKTQRKIRSIFSWKHYAAAIILILISISTTWIYKEKTTPITRFVAEMEEVFVPYGEDQLLTLADGSKVWLSAGSSLVYPKTFEEKERTMYLTGEARFVVAKNPEKPFIVKTHFLSVEALGTTFYVQSYPNELQTTTTLEEGSVCVTMKSDSHESVILKPGQELLYSKTKNTVKITEIDTSLLALKNRGYLIFENTPFSKMIHEIERKYNVIIFYDATQYEDKLYNVKFASEENIDEIFQVLHQLTGIRYKHIGDKVYINQ